MAVEVEIESVASTEGHGDGFSISTFPPDCSDQETQCNLLRPAVFSIDNFIENDRVVLYYTGFKTYQQFVLLFTVLGSVYIFYQ